jgi:hypothetical protein
MRYFKFIILLSLFSCCSKHKELISEEMLKQYEGYSIYYHRGTIFINSFENYKNNCSPIIVYYSKNKLDSISNKLNIDNTKCKIDSLKIKLLAQKFIELYPKYRVTNLSYFSDCKMSFGYSKPSKPEFIKIFNDSLINKYIALDDYKLLKNGWYELK